MAAKVLSIAFVLLILTFGESNLVIHSLVYYFWYYNKTHNSLGNERCTL
jgi:hypothetical protein